MSLIQIVMFGEIETGFLKGLLKWFICQILLQIVRVCLVLQLTSAQNQPHRIDQKGTCTIKPTADLTFDSNTSKEAGTFGAGGGILTPLVSDRPSNFLRIRIHHIFFWKRWSSSDLLWKPKPDTDLQTDN